ncbi:MAG TPA: heavy metal-binding domain-containing protein [Sphingobacteriaceae bacterium]
MKTLTLLTLTLSLFISACNSNTATNKSTDTNAVKQANIAYTCPMHPEVLSDKPGKCPKCKMDLVQKDKESTDDHSGHQH